MGSAIRPSMNERWPRSHLPGSAIGKRPLPGVPGLDYETGSRGLSAIVPRKLTKLRLDVILKAGRSNSIRLCVFHHFIRNKKRERRD
jgi:hypothetical protein